MNQALYYISKRVIHVRQLTESDDVTNENSILAY